MRTAQGGIELLVFVAMVGISISSWGLSGLAMVTGLPIGLGPVAVEDQWTVAGRRGAGIPEKCPVRRRQIASELGGERKGSRQDKETRRQLDRDSQG